MIAILTDFGDSEYTGVMKGVVYSINESSRIADLCNHVSPHNVREGAWMLCKSYMHFPKGTVFLCVVDPGVGDERQCIAIKTKNYFFVGPDNGLMHKAAAEDGIICAVRLSTKNASSTFHGRDVFAKAAAQLEKGAEIEALGEKTSVKAVLDFHLAGREGEIVRIDSFGNIVTNLAHLNKKSYDAESGNFRSKLDFYPTYESAPDGRLFLTMGSSDTLEIAMKNSSASGKISLKIGDRIRIK